MLSIVIPTKNEEEHLPVLLDSLASQTQPPVEIIVADAHSTDATVTMAKSRGCQVVEGGMPGVGRNRGAAVATQSIILFLDADVELHDPDFLKSAVEEFEARELDVATCDVLPKSDRFVDRAFHHLYNSYAHVTEPLVAHAPGFCIFVRKSLHDAIGGFDESVTFCEDHEYVQRARKQGTFGFLTSVKIAVSTRRFDRDGHAKIALKYVLAELHLMTLGPPRDNRFHYSFGYPKRALEKEQTDATKDHSR